MALHTERTDEQAVFVSLGDFTVEQHTNRVELSLALEASHPVFFIARRVLLQLQVLL